jgi:hypothetical protein
VAGDFRHGRSPEFVFGEPGTSVLGFNDVVSAGK